MAYADFATAYLAWLQNQLDYCKGKAYQNFFMTIDPGYEVSSFKQSTTTNQQKTFHNAADDLVAYQRGLNEIYKTPADYIEEYAVYLAFEQGIIQATAKHVDNTHENQNNSNSNTADFNRTLGGKSLDYLAKYEPDRVLH